MKKVIWIVCIVIFLTILILTQLGVFDFWKYAEVVSDENAVRYATIGGAISVFGVMFLFPIPMILCKIWDKYEDKKLEKNRTETNREPFWKVEAEKQKCNEEQNA